MRKTLAVVATTAALTFTGVAGAEAAAPVASAPHAQVTATSNVTADDTNENDDNKDKTGLWGLLGLLGLAGLAKRRENTTAHNH